MSIPKVRQKYLHCRIPCIVDEKIRKPLQVIPVRVQVIPYVVLGLPHHIVSSIARLVQSFSACFSEHGVIVRVYSMHKTVAFNKLQSLFI